MSRLKNGPWSLLEPVALAQSLASDIRVLETRVDTSRSRLEGNGLSASQGHQSADQAWGNDIFFVQNGPSDTYDIAAIERTDITRSFARSGHSLRYPATTTAAGIGVVIPNYNRNTFTKMWFRYLEISNAAKHLNMLKPEDSGS